MSTKQLYRFTDKAGPWVAGYRRDPVSPTILLTPDEAELDLLAGTIVRDGVPVVPVMPAGPVALLDRIEAVRGARDWDFTVEELQLFLAQGLMGTLVLQAIADFEARWMAGAASTETFGTLAQRVAGLSKALADLRAGLASDDADPSIAGAIRRARRRGLRLDLLGDPTTADLADGEWAVSRNAATGRVSLWHRDGATVTDLLAIPVIV